MAHSVDARPLLTTCEASKTLPSEGPSSPSRSGAALYTPRPSSPPGRQRSPIHARPLFTSCQPRCRVIVARPRSAQPTASSSTAPRSAPAAATRTRCQTASSADAPRTAVGVAYQIRPACRPSTKQRAVGRATGRPRSRPRHLLNPVCARQDGCVIPLGKSV
jgi:hypothetical protein